LSETLGESALGDQAAVPSIEDQAPAEVSEVDVASAPTSEPQMVEAARFNGLMGRFNRTQNDLTAAHARIAELEAQLATPTTNQEMPVTDVSGLEAKVNDLANLLLEERMENARLKALDEFPEAKPFADLITASTPTQIREVAEAIAQRVRAAGGTQAEAEAAADAVVEAAEQQQEAAPETPEPPVVAGGATFDSQAPASEAVQDAIARKDFAGYLAAKRAARALTTP